MSASTRSRAVAQRASSDGVNDAVQRSSSLPAAPNLSDQFQYYLTCCRSYDVAPDPSVATVLQCAWVDHLTAKDREFGLKDILPLCEVLKHDKRIRTLDLTNCDIRDNGVYALSNMLKVNSTITKLNLNYNRIGRYGATALGEALAVNQHLRCLKLRGNVLNTKCAAMLAHGLARNRSLKHLDVSNNNITVDGVNLIHESIELRRRQYGLPDDFRLDINGNFWMEELVNSITHGVGLLLAIVFGVALVREAGAPHHPSSYYWSCLVFTISLICLYTCSTLAHSFHRMKVTGTVFIILDHSCISILIAGSYTPFCMVTLGHMWLGTALCCVVWVLAFIGVTLSLMGPQWQRVELGLFVFMGWMVLPSVRYIYECLDIGGVAWLLVGGLFYTVGVYFFIKGQTVPIHHAIWHLFVLAGSGCHYMAIYLHVRPCSVVTGVSDDSKMWLVNEL